jgi:sugar phosphate permease
VDAAGNMQAVAVQHRYGRSIITSFHAAWSAAAITGALYVAGGERLGISLAWSILPMAAVVLLIILVGGPYLHAESSAPEPAEPSELPDLQASGGFRITVTRGPLLMLGLAMTCFWAVDSGVSNWSALYLHDLLHASGSTAALGFALYQSMALVSRLAGDPTVRRFGAVATVRTGSIIGTAGTMLVVLAPGPAFAIAGFGLAGLGLPVIAPLCFSAAGAAVRAEQQDASALEEATAVDSVVARLNVFNYLGSLVGAVLVGAVATVSDLRAGFVVPVVLAVSVFFLARAFATAPARAAE